MLSSFKLVTLDVSALQDTSGDLHAKIDYRVRPRFTRSVPALNRTLDLRASGGDAMLFPTDYLIEPGHALADAPLPFCTVQLRDDTPVLSAVTLTLGTVPDGFIDQQVRLYLLRGLSTFLPQAVTRLEHQHDAVQEELRAETAKVYRHEIISRPAADNLAKLKPMLTTRLHALEAAQERLQQFAPVLAEFLLV